MNRRIFILAAFALLPLVGGCVAGGQAQQPKGYNGPTASMADVIADINANNSKLPTLWGAHEFEATIFDEKGKDHFVSGDGYVFMSKPMGFRFTGKRPGMDLFDIGSGFAEENGEKQSVYWMIANQPDPGREWWGYYKNVGKPCVKGISLRPELLIEVLGLSETNDDFTKVPIPTMRFNNDADLYMLTWNRPNFQKTQWYVEKEIWYTREKKLPVKILLFDEKGRVAVRADLSNHAPVEVEGLAKDQWPMVARDFRMYFPDSRSKMWIHLREVHKEKTAENGRGMRPNENTFRFPENAPIPAANVTRVDKNCP